MSDKRSVPNFTVAEEVGWGGRRAAGRLYAVTPGVPAWGAALSGVSPSRLVRAAFDTKGPTDPRKPSVWQMEENKLGNSDLFFLSFSEGRNDGT